MYSVDKKNQLDVTFCILYLSSNSCSTCFGQPCAHHQELTTDVIASCWYVPWLQGGGQVRLVGSASMDGFVSQPCTFTYMKMSDFSPF